MARSLLSLALFLLLQPSVCLPAGSTAPHYVGPETCALCHQAIADAQQPTAMATTWQGPLTSWLPPSFEASVSDDLSYQFKRTAGILTYSLELPAGSKLNLPVEAALGGKRHGLGFLLPISQFDGIPLARPALLQARYAWSPERNKLLLAPGCPATRPQAVEAALGLTLSPTFESRCLSCHGKPSAQTGTNGGVHCESCHGPGSSHLTALGRGNTTQGILNPKRLSPEDSIAICAQCHVGLTHFADPSGDDLLVANQVRAIQNSECFLQSGKAFSCTACHDPHSDAPPNDRRALNACLGCHTASARPHAAICPVDAKDNCIGCHMPSVEMGPLHLVDHLIRVHPEQHTTPARPHPDLQTQVRPLSEYLRMISATNIDTAAAARDRIAQGESFYKVALEVSTDRSASIGGYLGRKTLADLAEGLPDQAARLHCGETSKALQSGARWVILQRLPRDFRWDAEQLQQQAEDLSARGDPAAAIAKARQALTIYPQFLRALNFIGTTFANSGHPQQAAGVLTVAAKLYPNDAATQFSLASVLNLKNDPAAAKDAYQKAIALEPDFTAAYVNLGAILYTAGDWRNAVNTFRQGLQIDPLCAELYYGLSLALSRAGDAAGAKQAMALANNLKPALSSADRLHQ